MTMGERWHREAAAVRGTALQTATVAFNAASDQLRYTKILSPMEGTVTERGIQPGEVHVLTGRGMPVLQGFGRGDHRVLVNVLVPRRLDDEQRRLLEEFQRSAGDETYHHDAGFFEKLKSAFR